MNEQLQTALLTILNSTINAAGAAKEFLLAEVPEVIRQLLVWKAIESGLRMAVWLAVAGAMLYVSRRLWKYAKNWQAPAGIRLELANTEDRDYAYIASGFLGIFSGLTTIISLLYNTAWLQIIVAPKLYLIEYAASLVK